MGGMLKLNKGGTMNFKNAKKKLEKIAKGKYHTLDYEITDYGNGNVAQQCQIYIDGLKHFKGETWELAFNALEQDIASPRKAKIESIEEI